MKRGRLEQSIGITLVTHSMVKENRMYETRRIVMLCNHFFYSLVQKNEFHLGSLTLTLRQGDTNDSLFTNRVCYEKSFANGNCRKSFHNVISRDMYDTM